MDARSPEKNLGRVQADIHKRNGLSGAFAEVKSWFGQSQGNRPVSLCLGCVSNTRPPEGLYELLVRIVAMAQTKRNQLDTLLPWNWKQQGDVAPLSSR